MEGAVNFVETEIGTLPESWTIKPLGELFDVQQGKALSQKARTGISPRPFLRTINVLWGKVDLTTIDQMDFSAEEVQRLSLKPGDLLICEGGEIGRSAVWSRSDEGICYQNHIHRLRRKTDGIAPDFVMYWMQAAFLLLRLYSGVGNRTTIPNLSGNRLKQLLIPVPSLPEQRAIAAVLAKIQAAVEVQDKTVATLKELKAATMAKLFREGLHGEPLKQTEIGEMPESWKVVPLQELCLKTTITDPTRNPEKSFQYVDVSSVSNDECRIISTTSHIGSTAPSRARKRVMAKDVIFATVRPTLRRVALVPDTLSGHIVSTAFCVLRATPERAVPGFIYYAVLHPEFISLVEGLQRGASYPAVSDGDILRQPIPVPSIVEQREIVLILSRIHEAEQAARVKRDTLKSLFSSMLHLLMTGQVRATNLKTQLW